MMLRIGLGKRSAKSGLYNGSVEVDEPGAVVAAAELEGAEAGAEAVAEVVAAAGWCAEVVAVAERGAAVGALVERVCAGAELVGGKDIVRGEST